MSDIAAQIAEALNSRETRSRQGKVLSVQPGPPRTLTVDIGGTAYLGIRSIDSVTPIVGEGVWMLDIGMGRWLAVGTTTAFDGAGGESIRLYGNLGSFISTPYTTSLNITGNLEIVVRCAAEDWTLAGNLQFIIAKDNVGGARDYSWRLDAAGTFTVEVFTAGANSVATSTVAPPLVDGVPYWLKMTHQTNNGSGGNTFNFYYAADQATEPTVWTQIGASVTNAGILARNANALPLVVGIRGPYVSGMYDYPFKGRIFRVLVRNGIGGAVWTDLNAATATASSNTWVSATSGETWTKHGTGPDQDSYYTPEFWIPVSFINGWTNYGWTPCAYSKKGTSIKFRGLMMGGTAPPIAPFNPLPVGYRINSISGEIFTVQTATGNGRMDVNPDGSFMCYGSAAWTSLSGLTYSTVS